MVSEVNFVNRTSSAPSHASELPHNIDRAVYVLQHRIAVSKVDGFRVQRQTSAVSMPVDQEIGVKAHVAPSELFHRTSGYPSSGPSFTVDSVEHLGEVSNIQFVPEQMPKTVEREDSARASREKEQAQPERLSRAKFENVLTLNAYLSSGASLKLLPESEGSRDIFGFPRASRRKSLEPFPHWR